MCRRGHRDLRKGAALGCDMDRGSTGGNGHRPGILRFKGVTARARVQGKLRRPAASVIAPVFKGGRAHLLLPDVEDPSFQRLQGVRDIGGKARNTDEHGKEQCSEQASWHLFPPCRQTGKRRHSNQPSLIRWQTRLILDRMGRRPQQGQSGAYVYFTRRGTNYSDGWVSGSQSPRTSIKL